MYYKALFVITFSHKLHQKGPEDLQTHICGVSDLREDKRVKKGLISCLEASSGSPGTPKMLHAAHLALMQVC